jgi:hypothetical protein
MAAEVLPREVDQPLMAPANPIAAITPSPQYHSVTMYRTVATVCKSHT